MEDAKKETAPNALQCWRDVALTQVVDCTTMGSSNMHPTRVSEQRAPYNPPQTLGHPEVVLVMYRWPGAYMLLQPCLPAAAASLSFSLWLCCSFVFHRDFSWPFPLPLSKLIPFLAFCFILFSTLTACSSVSWNPLIGCCCLCVFSVGTVKACLAVGCSLHIGRLLYPAAPGGGSSDR